MPNLRRSTNTRVTSRLYLFSLTWNSVFKLNRILSKLGMPQDKPSTYTSPTKTCIVEVWGWWTEGRMGEE